ncbi:sulfotransferase [Georgenia sp. AZ-5]|uniref:sulfotransferase n=1 Tax=Georgenia sp. AZ-5 TaxID=3367526 RepID=UPI003754F4C3
MVAAVFGMKDRAPRWAKDAANGVTRRYAMLTASSRPVPDFLVIGTKRGGTTSMFNYLLMHPGIRGLFPQVRGVKSTDYFFRNYGRGERWYRSHFPSESYRALLRRRTGYRVLSGEASPYYVWDPRIAQRVRELAPEVRAILLLRDPVERAWSHYQERVGNGLEPLAFPEALAREEERTAGELERMLADPGYYSPAFDYYSYRQRGVYVPQLRNWYAQFPAEQVLVLRAEDLYADVQRTFDRVTAFLSLPSFTLPTTRTFNASTRAPMPVEVRRELAEFFAPHNAELESLVGFPLGWDDDR